MKSLPSIIDVADLAGVSKSTVSRVMNRHGEGVSQDKRRKVLRAVAELGYVRNEAARNLRTDSSRLVMLAIPDITNPTWAEIARGAQDTLDEEGYDVVTANSDWSERRESTLLSNALRNRMAGLLINPVVTSNENLLALGIPTVIIGCLPGYPQFDQVGTDTYTGVKEGLAYLASLGHTRIALIMGARRRQSVPTRLAAYIDFHRETRSTQDDSLVVTVPFTLAGGGGAVRALTSLNPPPTAVICDNDILAMGVLLAARADGISVPRDLSILGMDDIFAASITDPPLTTIAKPKYDVGRQAAKLLLENMKGAPTGIPRRVLLPCSLSIRGTTAEAIETVSSQDRSIISSPAG